MAQKRASEVIKFLKECLQEQGLNVSKLVVFGSQAKGTATEESAIDLVIVSEDFRKKTYLDVPASPKMRKSGLSRNSWSPSTLSP